MVVLPDWETLLPHTLMLAFVSASPDMRARVGGFELFRLEGFEVPWNEIATDHDGYGKLTEEVRKLL